MRGDDAIDLALNVTRRTNPGRNTLPAPLPDKMTELIKLAAEHSETVTYYCAQKGVAKQKLLDAARLYLQRTILESGQDHYRTLGLPAGATEEQVRDHKRFLLKWLHPDRNHNSWESGLFTRVNEAAEQIERRPVAERFQNPTVMLPAKKTGRGNRKPKNLSFRPKQTRLQVLLRNVAMPVLTIAAAAAAIYVAAMQAPSGGATQDTVFSLLNWRAP